MNIPGQIISMCVNDGGFGELPPEDAGDNEAAWFLGHDYPMASLLYLYSNVWVFGARHARDRPIWIIPDKIDNKIPGFLLLKPTPENSYGEFTIFFAYVRSEFRRRGVLRSMLSELPKGCKVYLESSKGLASSVWKKCGFTVIETESRRDIPSSYGNFLMSTIASI